MSILTWGMCQKDACEPRHTRIASSGLVLPCYVVVLPSDDRSHSPVLAELELDLAAFWAEVEATGIEP